MYLEGRAQREHSQNNSGENKQKSKTVKDLVCPAKELESILEAVKNHKEWEKSVMERMCLHFRAMSAANEDQGLQVLTYYLSHK